MESGDPLRKIDRIVKAERDKRARKRFFFLLSLRGIGLLLIVLLAVSFCGTSWRMMQLYDALEPDVAADTVRANFGDPHHRVLIKEDGEIWYYPEFGSQSGLSCPSYGPY
jgi:hypothetical protein